MKHTSDLYLRPVTAEDIRLIYKWANDSETRKNAFNIEHIKFGDHREWFYKKLIDPNCYFYIFMQGNRPLGQIRVDVDNTEGYIDYSIAPEYRAQGYGGMMLAKLEQVIKADQLPIKTLVAEVKPDNVASQKKFEEADYEKTELIRYKKNVKK